MLQVLLSALVAVSGLAFPTPNGSSPNATAPWDRTDLLYLWEDYDADGLVDVYVHVPGGEDRLLHNRGAGIFEDATRAIGIASLTDTRWASWVDFDADGLSDLYVVTSSGRSVLLHNSASSFVDVTAHSGIVESEPLVFAEWIALDGDALPDLHAVSEGSDVVWRNLGAGGFSLAAALPPSLPFAAGPGAVSWTRAGPHTPGTSSPAGCFTSMVDQSVPGQCLEASSVPALGKLYPLGNELFIAGDGRVGVGTLSPTEKLDVDGAIRTRSGGIVFPDDTQQSTAQLVGPAGPEGPAGADGAQGPAGSEGPAGPAGADGAQGPAGPEGPMGPQGPAGADGAQGPAGPEGPVGPAGADGAQGPQGPAGVDGAQGPAGPAGPEGPVGPQGSAGADGAQGPAGPVGPEGPMGPQGLAGADGAQGPEGPTGPTGPAGPAGADGAQGPAGPTGADGAQGPAGPQGPEGPPGASPWGLNGNDTHYTTGNVGIGTINPAANLEVVGTTRITDTLTLAPSGDLALNVSTGSIYKGGALFVHTKGGFSNTALGSNAMSAVTIGFRNTASGADALRSNTSGFQNTASGCYALRNNTTGYHNTANGFSALRANTTGFLNTANGFSALRANTTGFLNTASGLSALYANTTGHRNTASGANALRFNTTGSHNTASGYRALVINTTGSYNTASGYLALANNTDGDRNIAIGRRAGFNLTTGNDNIAIGNEGVAGESATLRIGAVQTRAFIAGIRGVTTGNANGIAVLIDSAGQLGTVSSSERFKKDIADMGERTGRLLELRPVVFRYKQEQVLPDGSEVPFEYGLIAEEVAEIFPDLVVYDEEGKPFTVKYHVLSAMLLNELQRIHAELNARDEALGQQVQALLDEVTRLRGLEAQVEALKAQSSDLSNGADTR